MAIDILAEATRRSSETFALAEKYLNPNWVGVLRILGMDKVYTRAQGSYLYDAEGQGYLDFHTGEGVASLGHNNPLVRDALRSVLDADLSDGIQIHYNALSGLLAEKLVKLLPPSLDAVFFTNSGAEAVDTSLKFARAATRRPRFVSCRQGFHGLSFGPLSIVGETYFQQGFEPLLPGCTTVAFNDIDAMEKELRHDDVAAVICEPIQGRTVAVPDDEYLPAVQRLCRRHKTLFIIDEIQTGLGRTGAMFALEHWQLEPDMVLVGKALSGGYVPVAAVVTRRDIYGKVLNTLERSYVHHSTYARNRLAMAAGLATLGVIAQQNLVENARSMGARITEALKSFHDRYEMVKAVRSKGLMLGLEFGCPRSLKLQVNWRLIHAASEGLFAQLIVMPLLRDHRIITMVSGHNDVIKFLPPLTISHDEVDCFIRALDVVLDESHRSTGKNWKLILDLARATVRHKLGRTRAASQGNAEDREASA